MKILIIGGTRNLGHFLTLQLLSHGHQVTLFNRGQTPDELPAEIERLQGDRSNAANLAQAIAGRDFDAVVDMALYNQVDANQSAQLLNGRVGHYLFISTGQIYLVRQSVTRPFHEEDDRHPFVEAPPLGTRDYEEWLYGVEKSQAEDVLLEAWESKSFPVTILRLPMVNSERDHFHRIYNYLLRLQDNSPILLPTGNHLHLRHVFGEDVVQAMLNLIKSETGKGRAYNISQEETLSIAEFIRLLAQIANCKLHLAHIPFNVLEAHSLIPDCSPFSDPWMSELDNTRSKLELRMQYTPISVYLRKLVAYYQAHQLSTPAGYQRRQEEIELAKQYAS